MPTAEQRMRRVARSIRTMDRRADNLIPVWRKVGSYLARNNRRQFATKGAHYGKTWKPLKTRTMVEKLRAGYGRAPLVRTGAMKLDFIGRPMAVEQYAPHRATYGSDRMVAVWQHQGTRRNGRRAVPPRRIMVVTRGMRREIAKLVADHVARNTP